MLEVEIKTSHKNLHDSISEDYYKNKLMSKEDFDYYHGQNWDDLETELITEGYIKIPEPPRDLEKEIDELKARIDTIKELRQ